MLKNAEIRVEKGLVDVNDAEPETFGKNGFENPEALIRIYLFVTEVCTIIFPEYTVGNPIPVMMNQCFLKPLV